jgi:hypothetical protein
MNTKNIIESTVWKLFKEGKSEEEVFREISKSHSSYGASEKTVNK